MKSKMNIEEVQRKKRDCELKIMNVLDAFISETGVHVEKINIHHELKDTVILRLLTRYKMTLTDITMEIHL